ncbi:MAG: tetratricopeptide repeat protein [Chitinophagaceae bacterium]|nr:tetratricopeptide repeat protein [Chitinophagaceae bacterium]
MKIFFFLFTFIVTTAAFAQLREDYVNFDSLLNRGKAEFRKPFNKQDYKAAIINLKKAAVLNPDDPEVHYFLGYAYSRLNSSDGKGMTNMNLALTKQSSEEFEYLNQLTPRYMGDIVVLDPYSKLTAEWGSMAMCYLYNNKPDSAMWAFQEGKRRGGFSDFFLAINRYILNHCSKQAILLSSGDDLTMCLWYLQVVENYRKEVSVINVGLLNTIWYPQMIRDKALAPFDKPRAVIDTMEYQSWKDSLVWVRNKYANKRFSWTLRPTSFDHYLQRSDRLLLSMLRANEFEQDVFFTVGFDKKEQLSLSDRLLPMILLDKININKEAPYDNKKYVAEMTAALATLKSINKNSADEMAFVDRLRSDLVIHLEESHEANNKIVVKQLFKLLDTYFPEQIFPYSSKETKKYVDHLRKQY